MNKRLNLGCGNKKLEAYINADINQECNPDILIDLNKMPWLFKSNEWDIIVCEQVIEHLDINIFDFFKELKRILKTNGKAYIFTPNAFFWKNRIDFLLGKAKGSAFFVKHTKLMHPNTLMEIARLSGFAVKIKKKGLWFLPIGLSEQDIELELRKLE